MNFNFVNPGGLNPGILSCVRFSLVFWDRSWGRGGFVASYLLICTILYWSRARTSRPNTRKEGIAPTLDHTPVQTSVLFKSKHHISAGNDFCFSFLFDNKPWVYICPKGFLVVLFSGYLLLEGVLRFKNGSVIFGRRFASENGGFCACKWLSFALKMLRQKECGWRWKKRTSLQMPRFKEIQAQYGIHRNAIRPKHRSYHRTLKLSRFIQCNLLVCFCMAPCCWQKPVVIIVSTVFRLLFT